MIFPYILFDANLFQTKNEIFTWFPWKSRGVFWKHSSVRYFLPFSGSLQILAWYPPQWFGPTYHTNSSVLPLVQVVICGSGRLSYVSNGFPYAQPPPKSSTPPPSRHCPQQLPYCSSGCFEHPSGFPPPHPHGLWIGAVPGAAQGFFALLSIFLSPTCV